MMFAYELRDILNDLLTKKLIKGNVYYRDKNGKKLIIDLVDTDKEGNLILTLHQKKKKKKKKND